MSRSAPLQGVDFIDAPLVAATLEGRGDPPLDDAESEFLADHACSKREDVRVVVAARHFGHVFVAAEGGPDAGNLIGRDGGSDAGAADHNRPISLTASEAAARDRNGIRIVAGLTVMSSDVDEFDVRKTALDGFFEIKPAVIRCDYYLHLTPRCGIGMFLM